MINMKSLVYRILEYKNSYLSEGNKIITWDDMIQLQQRNRDMLIRGQIGRKKIMNWVGMEGFNKLFGFYVVRSLCSRNKVVSKMDKGKGIMQDSNLGKQLLGARIILYQNAPKINNEGGLIDALKERIIKKYKPNVLDQPEAFSSNRVAVFTPLKMKVLIILAMAFTIWWISLPDLVIYSMPEICLDLERINIMKKLFKMLAIIKYDDTIPMTDLIKQEEYKYIETINGNDELDIKKTVNRKKTFVLLLGSFIALVLISDEAFRLAAQIPIEEYLKLTNET